MQKNSLCPMYAFLAILLLALSPGPLFAEESSDTAAPSVDGDRATVPIPGEARPGQARTEGRSLKTMAAWVGMDIETALRSFGTPSSIFPLRGTEAWQDDVVFAWSDLELFWFRNRVWQLRFFSLDSLNRASTATEVRTVLGEPLFDYGDSWIYQIGGFAWPLRLRVDFALPAEAHDADGGVLPNDAVLAAFYLYRADF